MEASKSAECCPSVRRHVARTRLIRRLYTRETESGVDVYDLPACWSGIQVEEDEGKGSQAGAAPPRPAVAAASV